MNFEEFEKKILEEGYGIVAMNHYVIGGKRYLYCVVLSKDQERAFQSEWKNSKEVFENLYNQMINFENKNNEQKAIKVKI